MASQSIDFPVTLPVKRLFIIGPLPEGCLGNEEGALSSLSVPWNTSTTWIDSSIAASVDLTSSPYRVWPAWTEFAGLIRYPC